MTKSERISIYLEHISDAIDRATAYTKPIATVEAFAQNLQALDAVVRTLEIVGEAAAQRQEAHAISRGHVVKIKTIGTSVTAGLKVT